MAIEPVGPNFGHGPPWTIFPAMASGNHQRSASIPLNLRGILPFLHAPCTQGCRSGAYMVLYTIMHHFAQQFNGDIFRTKFHNCNSRSQNPMPISKEYFSTHQSGNPWR
ncbi:hypothetical protein O181_050284 [Austropuccinia psidii MF-1]|uniref:Uncharacterized protein n=1 Tax=Austropuccinia psidii MF-1 TaxID=1389203 RepID=A0A9Q3DWJ7_9BASI|nr:hypothetical protein [Austropuccinia psidii MF-1]